ncbi:GreA/GreB family elongation factor [Empedobacter falsenii]
MSKKHIRKEVIQHLIQLKQDEINALKESERIYAEGADLDEESSLELDDFAQQSQSTDAARKLNIRINQATEDLENFKALRPELINEITEGNVVLTDKVNFVIGLSFKDFEWENKNFVGISTQAPIFEALIGKRAGDKLEFNGIHYTIEEIL